MSKILKIPFKRLAAGNQIIKIYDNTNKLVFAEKDIMESANENAEITWTMRDFSGIAKDVEELTYIDGVYYYKNGDASVAEVIAIDNNDSLIIPQDTQLKIEISLEGTSSKLVLNYTVTATDVENVKRGGAAMSTYRLKKS